MASQKALPSLWGGLRLNTVWIAVGFFLLGQACFSGWSLIVSFSGCSSILPLFCLFDSLSRCFCHLSRAGRPVLNDFRSLDQDYLFNNLVAQFVGKASTSLFPSRSTPRAVKMIVESVWVPCRTVKWIPSR